MTKIEIEKINDDNFDEFLFLVEKLAEYEKLSSPDKNAKIRLRKDGLSDNPKYEAYLAVSGQTRWKIYWLCYLFYELF